MTIQIWARYAGERSSERAHFLCAEISVRNVGISGNTYFVETCKMLSRGGGVCGNLAECGKNDAAFKTAENKSTAEFFEELEISRSTLQAYLNGTGNPSLSMLDHIAERLDGDLMVLVSDGFSHDPTDMMLPMLRTMNVVDMLSEEKRRVLAKLYLQMLSLWEEGA